MDLYKKGFKSQNDHFQQVSVFELCAQNSVLKKKQLLVHYNSRISLEVLLWFILYSLLSVRAKYFSASSFRRHISYIFCCCQHSSTTCNRNAGSWFSLHSAFSHFYHALILASVHFISFSCKHHWLVAFLSLICTFYKRNHRC